jgi:hypothetical protein
MIVNPSTSLRITSERAKSYSQKPHWVELNDQEKEGMLAKKSQHARMG